MRAGAALMALPLALLLSPKVQAEEAPVTVDESTLYVASTTAVLPNILTADVPPTAICIVIPEICPPELDPVRDPAREAVGDVADLDISTPVQPVPPDTVSVAYLGGKIRYQSAIRFETPQAPSGQQIDRFDLVLPQAQPTFDMNSPAFRRIILALFETIGTEDPEFFVNGLVDALENEETLDLSQRVGIEACPLTAPFEPGGAPMAQSDSEIPRDDDTGELEIDCVLGSIGTFDAATQTWRFDLTFAVRAWVSGDLPNHGLLLRPIGAPNLAFGDADPTTNAQIGLDLATATSSLMTGTPAGGTPPPGPVPGPGPEPPPTLAGGTGFAPGDEVSVGVPSVGEPREPEVAQPPASASPPAAAPEPIRRVIEQPGWLWLVVPAFLIGGYLALSGLVAPAVAASESSSGAMTRLLGRAGGSP